MLALGRNPLAGSVEVDEPKSLSVAKTDPGPGCNRMGESVRFSVIVPTFNRGRLLRAMLQSLGRNLGCREDIEVVIVDNGSTDDTRAIYYTVKSSFPAIQWQYFYEPMPGLLSGRHKGAKEARGQMLSYLDDDVLLSPTWLEGLTEAFSNPEIALVGGPSAPEFERVPPRWLEELWHEDDGRRILSALSLIDSGPKVREVDPLYVFGLNFSIRRAVFEECGGFHPDCIPVPLQRYQGDGETGLSLKVRAAGLRALYHPWVAVKHVIPASRMTLESFERRGFYQGVCDSYSEIRRERRVRTSPRPSWRDLVRPAKWKVERECIVRAPSAEGVRKMMARAHFAGVQFHRNEVRNDPKLLWWVLRENYFHYCLPNGWEQYLDTVGHPDRNARIRHAGALSGGVH
jgi:glycosyltransferase involved in cell wall biosynthesis